MAAPKVIEDLVIRFERNSKEYMSSNYNEAQARQEFINPLFEALGWDMHNDQGLSDVNKEVLYEPSLNAGSSKISPDFAFRLYSDIKFLVEAKKPSVNIRWSTNPKYQLRNYAWNASLPISILTNFQEFAVYDCRYPPNKDEDGNTDLICYFRYSDYSTCWDWISSKFSKAAIQEGSLDRILKGNREGTRTEESDSAFLEEISRWKKELNRFRPEENGTGAEIGKLPSDPEGIEIREKSVLIRINQKYRNEMDADSLYDATRGIWKIGPRRDCAEYAFSIFKGAIVEVYKIKQWHPAGTTNYDYYLYEDTKRWEFVGELAESEIREKYLNKSVKRYLASGSRNPIKYVNC